MKTTRRLLAIPIILVLALTAAGCYTVVSTASSRGSVGYGYGGYAVPENGDGRIDRETASAGDDAAEGEEEVSSEFALKPSPYSAKVDSEEYVDENGNTIVNNYFFYNPDYYARWYARSWWYDPYWYDWRPGVYVGFGGWYDPYWWGPRAYWAFGFDWYWTDPYPCGWYYPWYRYPYSRGWVAVGWYGDWHHYGGGHYVGDHHGGGGGNGGGDRYPEMKYRSDRLAGFGTSRSAGGVVTVGGGGGGGAVSEATGKTTNTERTVRRDPRNGFGTTDTRRRDTGGSTSAEKPSSGTSAGRGDTRQNGRSETPARRRSTSDQMILRSSAGDEGTVVTLDDINRSILRRMDEQNMNTGRTETRIGREVNSDDASGNASSARRRATDQGTTQRHPLPMIRRVISAADGKTASTDKPVAGNERQTTAARTQNNTERTQSSSTTETRRTTERSSNGQPSSGSGSSYSAPSRGSSPSSSGGSRSSGSGGGGSSTRSGSSGGSQSGSRRR